MNRRDSRRYLLAYDVADDRRRNAMAIVLQSYGHRVQYSVFMVDCSPARVLLLQRKLESIMDRQEDSVLVCDLGGSKHADKKSITWLGNSRYLIGDGTLIV